MNSRQTFDNALGQLQQWAQERGIEDNGTVEGQARKVIEEAQEILDEIEHAMRPLVPGTSDGERAMILAARDRWEDALGDTGVAWIMACICADRDPVEMLYKAIAVIRTRRGHMNADGQFVKNK